MFSGLPHYYNLILSRLNNIKGLEIVVVAPKQNDGSSIGQGVHQTRDGINFRCHFLPQKKSLYKFSFEGFEEVLEKEKPDIVVTIFYYAFSFLYDFRVRKKIKEHNIKLIYKDIPFRLPKYENAVGYYVGESDGGFLKKTILTIAAHIYKRISGYLYRSFDAHVNYVEEAYDVFGSYGVRKDKIFITYNSIDTELIKEQKNKIKDLSKILPENPRRIFHVGRLVEWKRVDLLINAVHQLKEKYSDIELLIIGKGPLLEQYKKMATDLKLDSNVKFLGAIYDPELLGRYFKSCSVYVLAGMGGLSLNETMAWGLPVICSVCDGTEKHLIKDGHNGLFFKEGDLNDLILKIDYMLSDPERTKEMGRNAEKWIEEKINVHTVMEGYIKAFNYVTDNHYQLKYTRKEK